MSKPLKILVAEGARALIREKGHCCRNYLARDTTGRSVDPTSQAAVKSCGLGALIAAAYQITNDHHQAHELAIKALRPLYGSTTVIKVNDVRGHAAVLALLDKVLAQSDV